MNTTDAMMLGGFKIIIAKPHPKMMLSQAVPVTDEFRAEINAWMRDFFGLHYLMERGQTLVMEQAGTIIIHPADYEELRRATA